MRGVCSLWRAVLRRLSIVATIANQGRHNLAVTRAAADFGERRREQGYARLFLGLAASVGIVFGALHFAGHAWLDADAHGKAPCEVCLASGAPALDNVTPASLTPPTSPVAAVPAPAPRRLTLIETDDRKRCRGPPVSLFI